MPDVDLFVPGILKGPVETGLDCAVFLPEPVTLLYRIVVRTLCLLVSVVAGLYVGSGSQRLVQPDVISLPPAFQSVTVTLS